MALKAHKIALRCSEKERSWFAQQCGYARVAFNYGLSDFKDGLSKDEWRSARTLRQRFNAEKREKFEWCGACDQRAAAYALRISMTRLPVGRKDKTAFRSIRDVPIVNPTPLKVRR